MAQNITETALRMIARHPTKSNPRPQVANHPGAPWIFSKEEHPYVVLVNEYKTQAAAQKARLEDPVTRRIYEDYHDAASGQDPYALKRFTTMNPNAESIVQEIERASAALVRIRELLLAAEQSVFADNMEYLAMERVVGGFQPDKMNVSECLKAYIQDRATAADLSGRIVGANFLQDGVVRGPNLHLSLKIKLKNSLANYEKKWLKILGFSRADFLLMLKDGIPDHLKAGDPSDEELSARLAEWADVTRRHDPDSHAPATLYDVVLEQEIEAGGRSSTVHGAVLASALRQVIRETRENLGGLTLTSSDTVEPVFVPHVNGRKAQETNSVEDIRFSYTNLTPYNVQDGPMRFRAGTRVTVAAPGPEEAKVLAVARVKELAPSPQVTADIPDMDASRSPAAPTFGPTP